MGIWTFDARLHAMQPTHGKQNKASCDLKIRSVAIFSVEVIDRMVL